MSDEDLEYLHNVLRRMPVGYPVQIGVTRWTAEEIDDVVQMAQQLRAFQAAERITQNPELTCALPTQ